MAPVAYFITFTTYGTWLQGRSPGSVDRQHNQFGSPLLPADPERERTHRERLRQQEYLLDEERRAVVFRTIREVARHRGWQLWAAHVRSNHVHVVLTAADKPEKVMADLKAWCSRRLRENFGESADRDRWTQHGSTRYLWNEEQLSQKIAYVVDEQGEPMACYDSRTEPKALATGTIVANANTEPEALATSSVVSSATRLPVANASGSESTEDRRTPSLTLPAPKNFAVKGSSTRCKAKAPTPAGRRCFADSPAAISGRAARRIVRTRSAIFATPISSASTASAAADLTTSEH